MKVLRLIIYVILGCFIVYSGLIAYWINTTKIEFSKDYYEFTVEKNEIADYSVFENPSGKYDVLYSLDDDTRKQISVYMQDNNLKLEEGTQKFHRIEYTIEKLISEDFIFTDCN